MGKEIIQNISELLQQGRAKEVQNLVGKALEEGISPDQILSDGLLSGMSIIGEKFKANEVYVPEVLIASRATNAGMEVLKPYLVDEEVKPLGKVVIGTVQGDLHDIGKNLVKIMFQGAGFTVIDLGIDVPAEKFIEAIKKEEPQIVAMSALLTTTMTEMEKVIEAIKRENLRDSLYIMVGGAPVTDNFAQKIGADAYAPDAATAASIAKEKMLSA
ncbi:MAG: cobalamin-binding protein [Firmicutes bacterium]|nr:cobalamin-binding protein [Bacillota bacterium]